MKKSISLLLALTMVITSLSIAFPVFADTGAQVDTVVDELSELYRDEAEENKSLEDSAASRVIVKATMEPETYGNAERINGTDDVYIYQYETASEAADALEYYDSLSFVEWAETDGIMEGQSLSYGNLMVGGDEAKHYVLNHNVPLSEVNVALLDTGVLFSSSMFDDRVTDSGINLSNSGSEDSARDNNGHGTHIASIIVDNTTENVNITAYKVLNQNKQGTNLAVASGINMAVEDGADIISLSINSTNESELITEAVRNAYANGVIIVNSAGNESDDVEGTYPANMDEVFTVGSIDSLGNRAFFSNFGAEIDFVAPGYKVEMTGFHERTDEEKPTDSGTSYSVPYVVAAAAMVLSVDSELDIEQVKKRLIDSCMSMEQLQYHDGFHAVDEYDSATAFYIAKNDPSTDEECYGYGMPQILRAMELTEANEPVTFSVQSGSYHEAFELTLSAENGTQIYYTTDESYPSPDNGMLYETPIPVDSTMSVRAIAVSENKAKSITTACEYRMSYYMDESDFTIDDRGYITGYTGEKDEIVIPDTINGITVKGVAEYGISGSVRTIVFPDSVEELESYSLDAVSNLEFLIGHGIRIIGEAAVFGEILVLDTPAVEYIGPVGILFEGRELYLPELKEAGECAFSGSKSLREVYLPKLERVSWAMFQDCYVLRTVRLDSVETIENDAFANCYRLKHIYAPNLKHLTNDMDVRFGTFYRCYNLTEVNFPNAEEISEYCFYECKNLVQAIFDNAIAIDEHAFMNCTELTNTYFPNVETISYGAFYLCNNIKEFIFPNLKTADTLAFNCRNLQIFIAPVMEELGQYMFTNYSDFSDVWLDTPNLNTLIVPNVDTIDDYALAYLSGLKNVDLPNLKSIGENAFYESGVNYLYAPELETAESLPLTENAVVVVSDKLTNCTYVPTDTSLTIQGDKGSYGEEYADANSLEFIDVNDMGGSIRVTDAGLRFGYSFYDTQKKEVEEYGFVYAAGEQDRNDLTVEQIDDESVLQFTAYNRLTHEDETTTFNLVFTDIPQASYDTEVTARAYVKIDGKYFYSDVTTRSFNQVANAVLADDEIDQNTKNTLTKLYEEV